AADLRGRPDQDHRRAQARAAVEGRPGAASYRMTRGVLAGGWLALFGVYLVSLPGTFYFEDGPELLACATVLGNTHPPGYPLLMLLGRLALAVPLGGPGFRFNGLVAAC